ncbi:MAG: hypothetical protein IJF84_00695 [Thermoguttaceae bacterium]|nr:hypothetical protein [Thermoguttaceae bacterium]
MGLFNFWRKKDAQPTATTEEQSKSASAASDKGKASKPAKKSSSKKTKKADPGPDPLQLAVDKIATRPQGEYILYDQAANLFPHRILELGIDDGERIATLLQFGTLVVDPAELLYVGLDWFEDRTPQQRPGLKFSQATKLLADLGVKAKLQPGDPLTSFLPIANSLTAKKVDWVMISSEIRPKVMRQLWPLFPRILKPDTRFFIEKNGEYKLIAPEEVERIARKAESLNRQ